MDYKDTLNLPKTAFPMKANLPNREPEVLKFWEEISLYRQLLERHGREGQFILHDGPPYANGRIHLGHTVNKVLKDMIVKSRSMSGLRCPYVPGWDCHGLPIEHNVEKELGKKKLSMDQLEIREQCRRYAEKFVSIQREEFKRLGVVGDWENPYLTMTNDYEAAIARAFCDIFLKGYVVKRKKPVYWCPTCVTALAEAEVEYGDHTSPSIYVKFKAGEDLRARLLELLEGGMEEEELSIIIWTTTPWTLPANLAIALHPDYDYVVVRRGDEMWIVAEARLHPMLGDMGLEQKDVEILGRVRGSELEGLHAHHPFIERESLIVLATYVTLDAGTGCVHTAPGHGEDDYDTGLRYGLDIYAPVDERGRFTRDVPEFEGENIFKANGAIVDLLEEKGALLASSSITHSYPHCWRCKRPVIFRATSQWFITMEKGGLRQKALEAIDQVTWVPHWGKERIRGMVEQRPDWCISRQRAWGVPITVFLCKECETPYLDEGCAKAIEEAFKEEGADAWFKRPVEGFLSEGTTCPNCGSKEFQKETDILDVWFDSGVSHKAVLDARDDLSFPADLYLEGSDQHRGWFQSSLLTSVALKGVAPYRSVLTHGFVVDGKGKKMSKSVGNVIPPEKVIKRYGAEILRLWVSAEDYRDDIKISDEILKRLTEAYRKIRNTIRYILANLYDFDPSKDSVPLDSLGELDKWAIYRLQDLIEKVKRAYAEYRFHGVFHRCYQFCTVDLSALYLDIVKDRLYCEAKEGVKRRACQTVLYTIGRDLLRLLAPILSFTSEEAWRFLPGNQGDTSSIFLEEFPKGGYLAEDLNLVAKWERLLEIRFEITKPLEIARNEKLIGLALDARVTICARDDDLRSFIRENLEVLRDLLIISQISMEDAMPQEREGGGRVVWESEEIQGLGVVVEKAKGQKCQRCWQWSEEIGQDETYKDVCPRCASVLHEMAG